MSRKQAPSWAIKKGKERKDEAKDKSVLRAEEERKRDLVMSLERERS